MLKINVSKKDDVMTVSAERVKFTEMPYWTTREEDDMLQKQVYSIADNSLFDRLFATKEDEDGNEIYSDMTEEGMLKRDAFNDAVTYENIEASPIAKVVASGLGWYTGKAVPAEFVKVYEMAKAYCRTYKEATEWTDDRKADYKAIKQETEQAVKNIIERSKDFTVPEKYGISSKNLNGFLGELYTVEKKTDKNKGRVTVWVMKDLPRAFSVWSKYIDHSFGINKDEKIGKTITVF